MRNITLLSLASILNIFWLSCGDGKPTKPGSRESTEGAKTRITGDLKAEPRTVNFDETEIGETSNSYLTLKNTDENLQIKNISLRLNGNDFFIKDSDKCPEIDPQKSCGFQIFFTPKKAGETPTATIEVSYDLEKALGKKLSITLRGKSKAGATEGLVILGDNIFGQKSGKKSDPLLVKLELTNNNSTAITLLSFEHPADNDFVVDPTSTCKVNTPLASTEACTLVLITTPKEDTDYDEVWEIKYKDDLDQEQVKKVTILGRIKMEGVLISPEDFGTIQRNAGDSLEIPLTVTNNLSDNISDLKLEIPTTNAFQIDTANSNCLNANWVPRSSCTFTLKTTAAADQDYDEDFVLRYKPAGGVVERIPVKLKGKISVIVGAASDKDTLFTLLKSRQHDPSVFTVFNDKMTDKGYEFHVNKKTGTLYGKKGGKNEKLFISWEPGYYEVIDPTRGFLSPNPMSISSSKQNDMNDLAYVQRDLGIFAMKSLFPECYYAYAAARLKTADPAPRLLALERDVNPRPLFFNSDAEWDDFKKDTQNLFKEFKGNDSYVLIMGSGTTFFSQNPHKGRNSAMFERPPVCENSAKNPVKTKFVYTFDTPGAVRSDVDVNILIPEISNLCHKAFGPHDSQSAPGRKVYAENNINQCLRKSSNPKVRDMVKKTGRLLKNSLIPGSAFDNFLKKWDKKFKKREINISVRILPNQKQGAPAGAPKDFNMDPDLKKGFVIPIK